MTNSINGKIYYHFLSSKYATHDLERKMIRVSTLDTLNDPFELLPYLRYGKKDKIKHYLEIRKEVSKIYGLLCFSRTWREPLLWSHYADKHKGIALGFEINGFDIIDVDYDSNPIRKQFDLTSDFNVNKSKFLDLAKIKYKNWKYEEESRMLVRLDACTKIDGYYFIGFGNNLKVEEVRLGADFNYKANSVKYLLKLTTTYPGAEVIPCRLERQGYNINRDGRRVKKLQEILALGNTTLANSRIIE